MDYGVRQAAVNIGCLGGCLKALIVGALVLLLGPFALVTWLRAQGTEEAGVSPAPRAPEHHPVVAVHVSALLMALAVIAVLTLGVGRQGWRRPAQIIAGGLAVLQPGLGVGGLITLAVCAGRPAPFRYAGRGATAAIGLLMVALGAWHWAWPLQLVGAYQAAAPLPLGGTFAALLTEALL